MTDPTPATPERCRTCDVPRWLHYEVTHEFEGSTPMTLCPDCGHPAAGHTHPDENIACTAIGWTLSRQQGDTVAAIRGRYSYAEATARGDRTLPRVPNHMALCRCPQAPCVPHSDDGVHQWLDLCDLPHGHMPRQGDTVAARDCACRKQHCVWDQCDEYHPHRHVNQPGYVHVIQRAVCIGADGAGDGR